MAKGDTEFLTDYIDSLHRKHFSESHVKSVRIITGTWHAYTGVYATSSLICLVANFKDISLRNS
jgi:hypothetical protein